jgi:hypothetical protein
MVNPSRAPDRLRCPARARGSALEAFSWPGRRQHQTGRISEMDCFAGALMSIIGGAAVACQRRWHILWSLSVTGGGRSRYELQPSQPEREHSPSLLVTPVGDYVDSILGCGPAGLRQSRGPLARRPGARGNLKCSSCDVNP